MTPAPSWNDGVSFHALAERELEDTALYYERECPGLGAAFVAEIERCVAAIAPHPSIGSPVQAGIRRRLLRRFPYALLYRARDGPVRILAVMNLRRRPAYWIGRA